MFIIFGPSGRVHDLQNQLCLNFGAHRITSNNSRINSNHLLKICLLETSDSWETNSWKTVEHTCAEIPEDPF